MHNTICIDIERNLNLRHAAWRRRNSGQLELTEAEVIAGKLTLTLHNMNLHRGLVVRGSAEDLALSRRNRRVSLDQLRCNTAQRLNTKRQRRNIQKNDILRLTGQDRTLNCSSQSNTLVRVDVLVRLFAQKLSHRINNDRHTRRTADKEHVINIGSRKTCIV